MTFPWLKKNPYLSQWLSAANGMVGALRGRATAQARRHTNSVVAEVLREKPRPRPKSAKPALARAKASR
jgi:hypothetical protein